MPLAAAVICYVYYVILLRRPDETSDLEPRNKMPQANNHVGIHPIIQTVRFASHGNVSKAGFVEGRTEDGVIDQETFQDLPANSSAITNKQLREEAIKIWKKVPRTFLPEYRNPCWLGEDGELACLPYFYLIGMFKCGTTDLWNKLNSHPDVIRVPKEPQWWGPRRTGWTGLASHGAEVLQVREMTGSGDDSSIDWYLNWFKKFAVPFIKDTAAEVTSNGDKIYPKIFGDGSVSTSYAIGNDWAVSEPAAPGPPYTNADLLHAIQPSAKIIVMLRNPTERARSWYYYTHPWEGEDGLHAFVMDSIACFNACLLQHSERYCAYSFGCPYTTFQGLNVGLYHIYLKDWLNAYSRKGVLVLRLEDWHEDQVAVFRQIVEFLGIRPLTATEEHKVLGTRWTQISQKTAREDTRQALNAFHEPFNKELEKLLEDPKFRYD
ncbi:carbohydrate sulfotransferase 15-like [Diadema antillarum]|uniref:carbohydrate sulfotransferase 15-like n=1 Tax=Diadema antillarum TaxID=105358 RepID=UPI003A89526B